MRERPILMNGDMVRAILAGTKTQTRRPVKLNPSGRAVLGGRNWHLDDPDCVKACPFGQPGDRLWVRETWGQDEALCEGVQYRADWGQEAQDHAANHSEWRWSPSIHMPRWACRLVLEIVFVRVERLQEFGPNDAKAEGFDTLPDADRVRFEEVEHFGVRRANYALREFRRTWNAIYAAKGQGWDANPWVWVVEFKRTEASA